MNCGVKQKKMNKQLIAIIFFALIGVISTNARVVKGYKSKSTGVNALVVDSIDFRKGLTRVYGKLKGKPHTSDRIDKITLKGSINPKGCEMTDIDGIDAKRWYQWEDSGEIAVEIDFPVCSNKAGESKFFVVGPKGESVWTINGGGLKHRGRK